MTDAVARYVAAACAGDVAAALAVASGQLAGGVPPAQVMCDLVGVAQAEVGRAWEAGEISVATEHRATAVSEDVIASLAAQVEPAELVGRVVVTCVEGEWHSLPARITANVLRMGGWGVAFLGPSVPTDQLAAFLHDEGPQAVAISCVVAANLPGARRVIETARASGTPVLAGGSGFGATDAWARKLAANQWVPNAMAASGALQSLPAFTGPAPPLVHAAMAEHRAVAPHVASLAVQLGERYQGARVAVVGDVATWLVRFTSAALLVDDAELLGGYVRWMQRALGPRGLRAGELRDLLGAAADVVVGVAPTGAAWLREAAER